MTSGRWLSEVAVIHDTGATLGDHRRSHRWGWGSGGIRGSGRLPMLRPPAASEEPVATGGSGGGRLHLTLRAAAVVHVMGRHASFLLLQRYPLPYLLTQR